MAASEKVWADERAGIQCAALQTVSFHAGGDETAPAPAPRPGTLPHSCTDVLTATFAGAAACIVVASG